jgi:hypothetical protein
MIVTCFHKKGYDTYGRRMLESAIEFFDGDIVAYSEDFDDWTPDLHHEKISYRPLQEVYGYDHFMDYCSRANVFSGQTPFGYDYNHDAVKFTKKVFAQFDAFTLEPGKVIWVDADSVIQKETKFDFFSGKAVFHMGREGFYTESGVVGFDTEHPDFEAFKNKYVEVYRKGLIFTLARWHDCEALDWAIDQSGIETNNLSSDWVPGKDLDVLPTTVLGEYIKHYKGNQKWKSNDSESVSIQ